MAVANGSESIENQTSSSEQVSFELSILDPLFSARIFTRITYLHSCVEYGCQLVSHGGNRAEESTGLGQLESEFAWKLSMFL